MNFNTDGLIQQYFDKKNILVSHQINSYNNYVDEIIPKIIRQYFPVKIDIQDNTSSDIEKIILTVENLRIGQPLLVENNGCSKLMTHPIWQEKGIVHIFHQ